MSDIEDIAIATTTDLLESAEGIVDTQFGTGYAEKHPAVTAGCVQALAIVYLAEKLTHRLGQHADDIRFQLERIAGLDRGST